MARSNRLRLSEVRQAFRLVGECRDLGHDTRAWFSHALRGVQRILGSKVILGAFGPPEGFGLHDQLSLLLSVGWDDPAQEKAALDYLAAEQHLSDPSFRAYQSIARPDITLRPLRLISRKVFEASEYHARRRGWGMGDFLFSQRETADRLATFAFSPHRVPGEPFSRRDAKCLRLIHDELKRLVGNVLADGKADPLYGMPPRMRQALALLLEGSSEKEVALRMGISRHTVHDYVVALYKRFEVSSRAELLALCRRRRIGQPEQESDSTRRG